MRVGFTSGAIAATSNLIPVIQPMASSFQNPTKISRGFRLRRARSKVLKRGGVDVLPFSRRRQPATLYCLTELTAH